LADPQTVWVKANVDESQLHGWLRQESDDHASFFARRATPGQVADLGPERSGDRRAGVDVAFSEPLNSSVWRAVDVYIVTDTKKDASSLPSDATVTRIKNGRLVIKDGR